MKAQTLVPALPIGYVADRSALPRAALLFPAFAGFFFIFRICLTFIFFQGNPVAGTGVTIVAALVMIYGALLGFEGHRRGRLKGFSRIAAIRWIFVFLALTVISVLWTGAESAAIAFAYWVGMVADVVLVLLLLCAGDPIQVTESLLKGAVWAAAAVSLIVWFAPLTDDMRLGNDAFLHPNTLGLTLGLTVLFAQYLTPRGNRWKWLGILLAVTLFRSLSKTAIIAFVIAECWYLLNNNMFSRKVKLQIAAGALFVMLCFSSLAASYLDTYNNTGSGNQAETLTGRTVLWATALAMGMEKPWLGHGIYSFRALIPAFGRFEPVHAHNEPIQLFFEFGIVGVVIAAGVYWKFFQQARRAPASGLRSAALALLIFALVRGLTDTLQFGLSFPLWLFVALAACLARLPERNGEAAA